ncbi:MAG: hypothetical protein U0Q12_26375 [Vicinamibacterales bacterium]
MTMNVVGLVLAGLLQTAASLFEVGLWPGEGRPVFEANGPVQLRTQPTSAAEVTSVLNVPPGERLTFDDTVYRTVTPGLFRARRTSVVKGRDLGSLTTLSRMAYYTGRFDRVELPVSEGEAIEYLQYRAEGTCFVRLRSRIIDAHMCPSESPDDFEMRSKPAVEWWIHLAGGRGGWVIVSPETVKEVDRQG